MFSALFLSEVSISFLRFEVLVDAIGTEDGDGGISINPIVPRTAKLKNNPSTKFHPWYVANTVAPKAMYARMTHNRIQAGTRPAAAENLKQFGERNVQINNFNYI